MISDAALVPIREISRLTGVNTVTLRAWERRYGLIKPQRTSKGHRLYSTSDIARVQAIQSWLARGLAVSKVRAILAEPNPEAAKISSSENVWQGYCDQLAQVLQDLQRRKFDALFGELLGVYPPEIVADNWLAPALAALPPGHYANSCRKEFLQQLVREKIYVLSHKAKKQTRGPGLLLINYHFDDSDCLPLMLSYSLMVKDFRVEFFHGLPFEEWLLASEQLDCSALVIYSDSASRLAELRQTLRLWPGKAGKPIWVIGQVTRPLATDTALVAHLCGENLQQGMANLLQRISHQNGKIQ